jgi:hypothetical protein
MANLFFGALLAGLDLWGLRIFASSIGRKTSTLKKALLVVFLMGKFGLLAGAILLLRDRPWFSPAWFAAGLGVPFVMYLFKETGKHARTS